MSSRANKRHRPSLFLSSSLTWSWVLARVLLPCWLQSAHAQSAPVYTPRFCSGSAIANNTLYVISGTTSTTSAAISTAETLTLSLSQPFSVDQAPWSQRQAGYFVQDARAVSTLDQKHLVMSGVLDQARQLVAVYDLATDVWNFVPFTATASASPQGPRSLAGISLDFESGRVLLYGGLVVTSSDTTGQRSYSLSKEIDVLEINALPLDKWVWAAATESQVQPPGIVQPIQHYLPSLHATFVMGGATSTVNPVNGTFTQCNLFNAGYLIKATGSITDMASSIPVTNVELLGPSLPTPRIQACTVVLSNGDVFMYGGATPNETLNDAWILSTKTWTWSNIPIQGLPVDGRAGSTCQMATLNQLIVVGGYTTSSAGVLNFSVPQLAIINTDSWTWTLNFKPGPPLPWFSSHSQPSLLSTGAIIGIALGCCILLGILLFLLARKFWRSKWENTIQSRRKRLQGKLFGGTLSSEPLVYSDELRDRDDDMSPDSTARTSMIPFTQLGDSAATTEGRNQFPRPDSYQQEQKQKQYVLQHQHNQQHQQQQHQNYPQKHPFPSAFPQPGFPLQSPVVVKQLQSTQTTNTNARHQGQRSSGQTKKPSSAFLIIPYVPDESAFSTSSTALNSDSTSGMSSTIYDSQASPHNTFSSTTSTSKTSSNGSERRKLGLTDLPESARMPHTLADMHHGQYVKTLQHHKQYERRRQEELRLNSGLARSGTHESLMGRFGHVGYDDEDLGLATGVLRLREVDLGEESISGSVNGVEAGTILLSSHLETSVLESEGVSSEWP